MCNNVMGLVGWSLALASVSYSLGSSIDNNPHHLTKREVNCLEKYATITTGHTACRQSSENLKDKGGVSEDDKRLILDKHNAARREVSPTARRMFKLSWDNEIATTAQRWAENCDTDHDDNYKRYAYGKYNVGQNLAWGSSLTWGAAIDLWVNERNDFTYGGPNGGAVIGHYTAIVWDTTLTVGCGYAQCLATGSFGVYTRHYYVCNYGPGGNIGGKDNPYETGTSCNDCPAKCIEKLCDCAGKVCYNGGTLDPNTCECTCKAPFHLQPSCDLNCTDIQDMRYCTSFSKADCERFYNVPQECPDMCGWCPTAGFGYNEVPGGAESHAVQHVSKLVTYVAMAIGCYLISKYWGR